MNDRLLSCRHANRAGGVFMLLIGVLALSGCRNSTCGCTCEEYWTSCQPPPPLSMPPAETCYGAARPLNADAAILDDSMPSAISGDAEMLRFLSTAETGTTRAFTGTSWGRTVQATAGEHYHSALGGKGRGAVIFRLDDQAAAALALVQNNGQWEFAPDVRTFFRNQ